jgi:acetoin utilization deacetylase AcuC-like enzyme
LGKTALSGADMTTLLYSHPACAEHDPGAMHPESSARLVAVLNALAVPEFAALERREAPPVRREQLIRAHPEAYVDAVFEAIPETGHASLDADTTVSPGSGEAARRAAGALCAAVDAVAAGEAGNAFCAVRPPGHHAEPARPMGFCVFNNVAIGALQARAAHGHQRVAVVDFDVHHGNGTQAMFWDDPDLFFASTHQMPLYPGTGGAEERGAHGNIVNMPLAPLSGSGEFRAAMSQTILPALRRFAPDFLLISAGFDAHADDPLAGLRFHEDDYAWATEELLAVARESCDGRVVSTLEGGYNLAALAASAAAHVGALMAG